MFKVYKRKKKDKEFVTICNESESTKAEISLNNGASVSNLVVNNKKIITDLGPKPYEETYASSIMFPFANRINYGKYFFLGKKYQLECNEKIEKNALHGLIYNKKFLFHNQSVKKNSGEVNLSYKYENENVGFPFSFMIDLNYCLHQSKFTVFLKITNIGEIEFPFTTGWHPYFETKNLNNSTIEFNSLEKIKSDNRNITTKIIKNEIPNPFFFKDKILDDAYILNKNKIFFKTEDYSVKITSSEKENYLQLYTPKNDLAIAIEPMTGVSDSFNNGIGLKKLYSKDKYEIKWELDISTSKN